MLGCILLFFLWVINAEEPELSGTTFIGVVVDKEIYDTNDRLAIKINHKNYHMYVTSGSLEMGDEVMIKGELSRYENRTVPEGFDRYMHYRSNRIMGKITLDHYEKIGQRFTLYTFRDKIYTFYREQNISHYAMNLLFGEDLAEETKTIYQQLGLTYLLSISGLHLFVLITLFRKILFYFSVSDRAQSIIVLCCYVILCYLHRFELGILRLTIMHSLLMLNDHYAWRRSRFEIMQLTFIGILLTNIALLFSSGILISYMILTMIYLIKPWFDSFDGYVKRLIFSGFLMIWLLPFFQRFDPILIILMPLIIVFIVYGLTIGAFLTCLVPSLSPLLDRYGLIVEKGLLWLNDHRLAFYLPKFDLHWIIIYYGLFIGILIVKSKLVKGWILMIFFCLIVSISGLTRQTSRLLFLDVGQGDATIVETKDCIAVIDSFSQVHDYLYHRGIARIDYLFLTHSDIDHIKEADIIIRDFQVDHLIGSKDVMTYPNYGIWMEKANAGDTYPCGDINFHILSPIQAYTDENNASLVIQFDFHHSRILLMGDIEIEAEMDLIMRYGDLLKSDVLKIAHHGSSTSSSSLFLNYVKPQRVIISAGRNNHYHFPHDEVINRLMDFNLLLYRTDQQGTIVFEPNRKGGKWYFYLPFSPRFWYNMYRVRGRMYG